MFLELENYPLAGKINDPLVGMDSLILTILEIPENEKLIDEKLFNNSSNVNQPDNDAFMIIEIIAQFLLHSYSAGMLPIEDEVKVLEGDDLKNLKEKVKTLSKKTHVNNTTAFKVELTDWFQDREDNPTWCLLALDFKDQSGGYDSGFSCLVPIYFNKLNIKVAPIFYFSLLSAEANVGVYGDLIAAGNSIGDLRRANRFLELRKIENAWRKAIPYEINILVLKGKNSNTKADLINFIQNELTFIETDLYDHGNYFNLNSSLPDSISKDEFNEKQIKFFSQFDGEWTLFSRFDGKVCETTFWNYDKSLIKLLDDE
jgi:hypothetical protein